MKKVLLDFLICPACLPAEQRLQESIAEATGGDIIEGRLTCSRCQASYPIKQGIAFLDPHHPEGPAAHNRYETLPVLISSGITAWASRSCRPRPPLTPPPRWGRGSGWIRI